MRHRVADERHPPLHDVDAQDGTGQTEQMAAAERSA